MCFHKIIQNLYKTTKYMVEMSNWGNKIRDYEKVIHPYNSESLAYKKIPTWQELQGEDSCMFTDSCVLTLIVIDLIVVIVIQDGVCEVTRC